MNILLIGSGGREHAFAWKISQSNLCNQLFVAPGNPGTAGLGKNLNISITDFEGIKATCIGQNIDLIVVGPEEPLVKGLRDYLKGFPETKAIPLVGPGKDGALLEGSKDFSKGFMIKYGIPTAAYQTFTKDNLEDGLKFIESQSPPIVLKADGLAAGKGVLICANHADAKMQLGEMLLGKKFGEASSRVVIEEFLVGIELSVFVATDGDDYVILPEAKDYKRIGENDTGPNTGGMGAVSPVPFADESFMSKVENRIVKPTMSGLKKEGIDYRGFLFIGLMNREGDPYVIEYNVRMGDPETQAVLPRIKSDFVELLSHMGNKTLNEYKLLVNNFVSTTVVMVAGGYPGSYEKGKTIIGLSSSNQETGLSVVFHAGTKEGENGEILTNGGRVLGITGQGETIQSALSNAYDRVDKIHWEAVNFRRDIGQDILKLTIDASHQ
ncbi:phosphoribosylamine--glycine ligase [Pleomorphovibrio marinus]|uniref:phosphoribosylamine--glycine ligase n=1 Tax=Pleomorphovibrio marinus TaxID=2164132 RepID=UPI000E0CABD1|nr:phosphoribosylamine--glycine ligase [Pleomorphovibrio marinus]